MDFRHEYKYIISTQQAFILKSRLETIMSRDEHTGQSGSYEIRSIYFDDMYHSAVEEKIAGTRFRKKFRIRSYELDNRLIRLECKSKYNEYISKIS